MTGRALAQGVRCWSGLLLCVSLDIFRLCVLIMDWMQQSLAPPPGGVWSVVPQLTTALGYGLLACETCMLNFDPVSMSSRPSAGRDLVPVRTWARTSVPGRTGAVMADVW